MASLHSCGKDSEEDTLDNEIVYPGVYDLSVSVDTLERWFKLIVPPNYNHTEPRPLLMAYHGGNLSMGFMFNNRKDLINRCAEENWILVFTNGANDMGNKGAATWNAIHCCAPAYRFNVDDIGYTEAIVEALSDNLKIDNKRLYAIGGSNGAMFVHKLASELPHVFAAVAENQGTIGGKLDTLEPIITVQPKSPIPIMMIHGMNDHKVQFNGGWSIAGKRWDVPFSETVSFWARNNQCDLLKADTTIINGNDGRVWIIEMKDCVSQAPVKAIAIENKGHGWPGLEESGYDGTNASIDFLKQFSK